MSNISNIVQRWRVVAGTNQDAVVMDRKDLRALIDHIIDLEQEVKDGDEYGIFILHQSHKVVRRMQEEREQRASDVTALVAAVESHLSVSEPDHETLYPVREALEKVKTWANGA